MNIHAFDWDEKNEDRIAEHGISIPEVEEAILFSKPFYQRARENKHIAYAVTEDGRYLFVVFVIKDTARIRVISARDMTGKEKHYYKITKSGRG